jgi:transmembrane sensor
MKLQRQIDKLLAQRASEWHQILQNADESQRAEFVAWLKQSPLHIQEYLETTYTDKVLAHLDPDRREDIDALLAQAAPSVVPLDGALTSSSRLRKSDPKGRTRWLLKGVAAGVVLCALGLPLAYKHFVGEPEYTTTIGEQRTVELSDSSVVTLNADSRIQVHLYETHRDIELVRGEALFKVSHDPSRPFTVRTATAIVQAVGTQFNVYEKTNGTLVSVLEGQVTVRSQGPGSAGAASTAPITESLGANQEALVKTDGIILRIVKADVSKTVAWRERRLIFQDAPLEDMVHEFNRYSRNTRLTLDGVPPGSHHYNGIFDAADPDSLADLLSKEPDLSVERRPGEIVIRKR